ncbi:metallophosphoesterase [Sphingomonas sp.]|uniref:metallophosphoesterase n=1 Tax=Sphingomonas sp. TaxID=28214 RepID=UPI003D6C8FB3
MRVMILFAALIGLGANVPATQREERPAFSIGAIADAQYVDAPDNGQRLYHTAPGKLAAAIADFNRQRLAFVVHLGDFIDHDWPSYDALLPIARKLKHPWHFALGNHEFAVDDAHKSLIVAKLGMPARYYCFKDHGWLFIVTDGNDLSSYGWPEGSPEHKRSMDAHAALYADKPLWDGGIGDAQLRWIDAQLAEADRRGLKAMLFSHFPLYPENPHNLWNTPAVMALLDRHASAKIWLDGHNHDGNYGVRAGIHYVNLKAMLDTPETSYARLDFFADRVVVKGTGRQSDMVLRLR